ncbi:alpha/beta fold hydrolase [Nonomuraea sp. NPDC050394]|uniref:alpha/beta fold hydrolase n=1 Tax=Nonomuraea sp. NPDC050394 TaxID=3364363 RepID=UPI0037A7B15D
MSCEIREPGTETMAPVLLLHGDSVRVWDPISGVVAAAGHRVIAWEGTGNGHPDEASSVLAALDELGVSAFHVVGHGTGALTALHLARTAPARALSCGVIAGHEAAPTGDAPAGVRLACPPADPRRARAWALERLSYTPHHIDDALLDAAVPPVAGCSGTLAAKDALYAHARDHGFQVPIMLIWGSHDPLSEVERGVALFDLLASTTAPLSLHVVNRAGHFVFRERPREVLRLLLPFLARSERPREGR